MKKMTCKQLGGACDLVFQANTFEEMVELSKAHGMEMFQKKDVPHINAMSEMMEFMKSPEVMKAWLNDKMVLFEALPNE